MIHIDALAIIFALPALYLCLGAFRHFFYSTAAALASPKIPKTDFPATRFTILIPAHNEESGIVSTVESAKSQEYPKEMFRVVVLADNCTDRTAELAKSAGVEAAVRNDPENLGKGYALNWYIENRQWTDNQALVCLDADSVAETGYLLALDARIQNGAPAVQGYNGCKEPDTPLAALTLLTNTMKNAGTYGGRAVFGLPAPLMNGWCLTGPVLRRHGWQSFSIAEDFEQTLRLALEGVYAVFSPESAVRSEKAGSFSKASSQRKRWSGGQSIVARSLGFKALGRAAKKQSLSTFELAMDLMLPGYSMIAAGLIAIFLVSAACQIIPALAISILGILFLGLCALIGYFWAGPSWKLTKGLLLTPVFIVWKIWNTVSARLSPPKEWKRAKRNSEKDNS